jgi:hypothetical protein
MPKLSMRDIRSNSEPKPYNLNSLVGVHFSDTNSPDSSIAAFPRRAWYSFESMYEEVDDGDAEVTSFFRNNDFATAGSIILPTELPDCLCLNTLRANWNPAGISYVGGDAIDANVAPYGTAEIAGMYKTYRVTSAYFKFKFTLDTQTMTQGMTSTGTSSEHMLVLRGGYYVTQDPTTRPIHTRLREAIIYGKIPTKRWVITNSTMRSTRPFYMEGNLNIKDQFDQEVLSTDKDNDAIFSALIGSGPNDEIADPAARVYIVPFFYVERPLTVWEGQTKDTNIDLTTCIYSKKYTLLTNPKVKTLESET